MFENIVVKLPPEKKRLAKILLEIKPDMIMDKTIVSFALENSTSPSMVTRTLKEIGFYGWKDYQAFIIGNILAVRNNTSYWQFYKNTFGQKIETTTSWIDANIVSQILTDIKKYKLIYFVLTYTERVIAKEYEILFRSIGVEAKYIDLDNDSLNLVKDYSVIFFVSRKEKTNEHILTHINKLNHKLCVSLVFGDVRRIPGTLSVHLVNDRNPFVDTIVSKVQFRMLFNCIMDMLLIKYYATYVKKIDNLSELNK